MYNSAKKRFDNLDLLKAVAMMMVVSLHIPVWEVAYPMEQFPQLLPNYAFRLLMEGVPIFVMVNGFLMFHKRELRLEMHLKKIVHFLLLLIVWSFLMIIGGMVIRQEETISLEIILTYFFNTSVWAKYTGVLWFLQSLIGLYLVMPVLKVLYDGNYKYFKYLFYVVAFFTVGIDAIEMLIDLLALVAYSEVALLIPGYLERFSIFSDGYFVLYAMLGGMLLKHKESIEKKRVLFIGLGVGAWIMAILCGVPLGPNPSFNYGSIFMLFLLVGWYAATLSYQNQGKWYHKVISSIGENTLGIYFLHIFVIAIVRMILPYESFGVRVVQWGIAFVASWIGSLIMKKIPVVKELVR